MTHTASLCQGALLAGSFSWSKVVGGSRVGDTCADSESPPFASENEDEDTEFEKRACGHLGVWCAPLDSDILDSSNACSDTIIFAGGEPPEVEENRKTQEMRTADAPTQSPAQSHPAEITSDSPAAPLGGARTWREGLMKTIGIAACCSPATDNDRETAPALQELPRPSPQSTAAVRCALVEDFHPDSATPEREEGLWNAPDAGSKDIEDGPRIQLDEAAMKTKEWASMFETGWIMAAGGNGIATTKSGAPGRTPRGKPGSYKLARPEMAAPGDDIQVHTVSLLPMTRCPSRDEGAREMAREPTAAASVDAGGLWVAPHDDEDDELKFAQQQETWEMGIRGIHQEMDSDEHDVYFANASTTAPPISAPTISVATTNRAPSLTPNTTPPHTWNPIPAHAHHRVIPTPIIPKPCFSPSTSSTTSGRPIVATPSGSGGGKIKSMIQKMKKSPGGLFRVSPGSSTPKSARLEQEPSAADHIAGLVKKAELNFEKEHGAGSWGGVPARQLVQRAILDAQNDGTGDEGDDLLV